MTTEYKRTCLFCGSDEDRPHDPWSGSVCTSRNWLGDDVEIGYDCHTSCEAENRLSSNAYNDGYRDGHRNALAEAKAKMRSVFGGDPDDAKAFPF